MKKTLVLIADFINEIVDARGVSGAHNAKRIETMDTMEKANEVIQWARSKGILVAHVTVGFAKNYATCPKDSLLFGKAPKYGVFKLGTWSTEFHEKMDVQPQDHVIVKHRVSAFYNTDLETLLRANKIERIVICGVSTTYVVENTTREAHDRDYEVTIISDGCNAATEESHQASLEALSKLAYIKTAEEFITENS